MRFLQVILWLIGFWLLACRLAPSSREPTLRLERTPCFGSCPSDVFTVYADGRMTYQGGQYAPRSGNYAGKLSPAELSSLVEKFERANFFAFANDYVSRATDLPTTYVFFSHEGRSKTVRDLEGAPDALKTLEADLIRIINDNGRWQPTAAPAEKAE